jgi:hypothetical protein
VTLFMGDGPCFFEKAGFEKLGDHFELEDVRKIWCLCRESFKRQSSQAKMRFIYSYTWHRVKCFSSLQNKVKPVQQQQNLGSIVQVRP